MSMIAKVALRTLNQRSSVLMLCSKSLHKTYTQLAEKISSKIDGEPEGCLVLFMAGPRQKGFTASIAKTVYNHGGNIEKSNHAILGDFFTGVGLVTLETSKFQGCLADMKQKHPNVHFNWSAAEPDKAVLSLDSSASDVDSFEKMLKLEGPDSKGIVANVTEVLNENDCRLKNIVTSVSSAPFAGYNMFNMIVRFSVVNQEQLNFVKQGLKNVEKKFGVEIIIKDVDRDKSDMIVGGNNSVKFK